PQPAGLRPASLYPYVPTPNTASKRGLEAGAKGVQPGTDMSGATASRRSRIPPATSGRWRPTRKTSRPRRSAVVRRTSWRPWAPSRKKRSKGMREIHVSAITDAVKKLCMEANLELEPDMLRAFDRALQRERSPAGKQVLQ